MYFQSYEFYIIEMITIHNLTLLVLKMLKRIIYFFWFIFFCFLPLSGKDYTVISPDRNIRMVVRVAENISYSMFFRDKEIIKPSAISMTLDQNLVLGKNPQVKKQNKRK